MTRRRYIDWARGVAVLVMIEAHTLDAWVRPADRSTHAFSHLMMLAGLAAPMFLWLAGTASILAAEARAARSGNRRAAAESICRRGLEIFILAFLFRIQAFILSPGSPMITLFRVDILNVMGPAIVGVGSIWGLVRNPRTGALILGALSAAVAMITPVLRTAEWVSLVPTWIQWYLRPAGEHTTFTLFPWCGFVFAGAAVGLLIAHIRNEARLQAIFGVVGVLLIWAGFFTASLPSIYRSSSFWTSSPTYFAVRAGVLVVTLSAAYSLWRFAPGLDVSLGPLERLGRSSLFIYWIHVELVYGYASWAIRGRLHLWQAHIAFVLFSLLMYGSLNVRDRAVDLWRSRQLAKPVRSGPTTAQV